MIRPVVAPAALDRLRRQLGRAAPAPEPDPAPADGIDAAPTDDGSWTAKAKALSARAAAPLVTRFRAEVSRAVADQDAELRHEVEALREELVRTRTAHDAELAALHEQLRSRS